MSTKLTRQKVDREAPAMPPGGPVPVKPRRIRIPMKWVWHYGILQALRERLFKEREGHLAEAGEPLEPHSMDPADSATDEFDHDMALAALSREQDALRELDAAIARILDGTYGLCEETGKRIPAARLRAVPWTRYSKNVEERLEREGGVDAPRLGALQSVAGPVAGGLGGIEEPDEAYVQAQEIRRHQREAVLESMENEKDESPPPPL